MISLLGNPIKRIGLGAIKYTGRITLIQIEPVWGHGGMIRCLATKVIPPKPVSTGQMDNISNDLDDVRNKIKKVRSDADSIRDEIKQAQGKIKVLTDEWERAGYSDTFSKQKALASLQEQQATLITREATLINERKELEAKLPQPPPPPPFTPFHDAFQTTINTAKWPTSLNAFLPKPFKPPPHSPYVASAKNAKIMASFRDPTKPDMLLTGLDEDINFSHLPPVDVDEELRLKTFAPHLSLNELWRYGMIKIIAPPGTGKTRFTLQLGWRKYIAFFVCDKQGNGGSGSDDLKDILDYATKYIETEGKSRIAVHVHDKIRQAYTFRAKLLEFCKTRYGEKKFQPRHWTMLQMYSKEIIGVDIFKDFGTYNINVRQLPHRSVRFDYDVLDEAQIADNLLEGTFPSSYRDNAYRSLLSRVLRAFYFLNSDSPAVVCATKLSSSASFESMLPVRHGTMEWAFGMSTYLDSSSAVKWLENWGVNDAAAHKEDLEVMKGRPGNVSHLAENLLCNADWPAVLDKTLKDACNTVRVECGKLEGQRVSAPNAVVNENSIDMLFFMRTLAQQYRVGRRAIVTQGTIYAIEYGFAGFNAHDMRIAIREPIVVAALLTDENGKEIAMDDEFEVFLPDDDGVAGTMFQDYMVRHGKQVAEFVSSQAKSLGENGGGFLNFKMQEPMLVGRRLAIAATRGEEATMLEAMLSGKNKISMMRTQDEFGPDLVRVFWKGDKPMVVFEQHKSGGAGTFEEAFRRLEHLQCKNLKNLKACIMKYNAVVVYLVVKPMSDPGSLESPSIVADSQFNGMNVLKVVISSTNVPTWMNKAEKMLKMLKGRLPLNLPEGPP